MLLLFLISDVFVDGDVSLFDIAGIILVLSRMENYKAESDKDNQLLFNGQSLIALSLKYSGVIQSPEST